MSAEPRPGPGVDVTPVDESRWADAVELLDASVGLPRFARLALECLVYEGWRGQAWVDAFNVATVNLAAPSSAAGGEVSLPAGVRQLLDLWASVTSGASSANPKSVRVTVRAFAPRESALAADEEGAGVAEGELGGAWEREQGPQRVSERMAAVGALGVRVPLEMMLLATAAGAEREVRVRALRVRTRGSTLRGFYLDISTRFDGTEGEDRAIEEGLRRWGNTAGEKRAGLNAVLRTRAGLHFVDLSDEQRPSSLWAQSEEGSAT